MGLSDNNYVYIAASWSRAIYIGVTRDLERRMYEHKTHQNSGHTYKYNEERLVYYERFSRFVDAIAREKQLKGWRRSKKVALIEAMNPEWLDLATDWDLTGYEESTSSS